ncbi:MAG TPA: DUF58 domain-containing protein [Trichocoleus sp.]|jgi:uncharacterized protein (DUF58 family)
MSLLARCTTWLESRWIAPSYSGWLMLGLSVFFFGAATNTMAGWLYVISGVMFALLLIAALLPHRTLRGIHISRTAIPPVSVGDSLVLELRLENQTKQPKTLIEVKDLLPFVLSLPSRTAVELILPGGSQSWITECLAHRRGLYHWQTVNLRTATPFGLFWCRRSRTVPATAIVYPTILPLTQCPIIDQLGQDLNTQVLSNSHSQAATEGLTRTLRPYRWGDPIRLVHWRTSARYGELRVRELETYQGGQEVIVALDSAIDWNADDFEQAVSAAASLYFYALNHRLAVSLWTAQSGLLRSEQTVLPGLAAVSTREPLQAEFPDRPLIWLTQNPNSLSRLPSGSRWLLWQPPLPPGPTKTIAQPVPNLADAGVMIQPDSDIQMQLQAPLSKLGRSVALHEKGDRG